MILALEATDRGGSIALAENGHLLDLDFRDSTVTHSERLMPVIDDLLDRRGRSYECLEGIAVARGPGSFTAIRLAVTTAKTLAMSCDVPVLAPTTLRVMAEYAGPAARSIVSVLDARRGELYVQRFRRDNGVLKAREVPSLVEPGELDGQDDDTVIFRGREHEPSDLPGVSDITLAPGALSRPLAGALVDLADRDEIQWQSNPDGIAPCYVRQSDAQRSANGKK